MSLNEQYVIRLDGEDRANRKEGRERRVGGGGGGEES